MNSLSPRGSLRLQILCISTLTWLAGCATPPPAPEAPELPAPPQMMRLPSAPRQPQSLDVPVFEPPTIPASKRQDIDEVYEDFYKVIAAPESFKLPKEGAVIVALPENLPGTRSTTRLTASSSSADLSKMDLEEGRVLLAGSFLANGFKVKDAGEYKRTTLKLNILPEGEARTISSTTLRSKDGGPDSSVTKTTTTDKPWYFDGWYQWYSNRGLKIDFVDPTSFWVTQLAKYSALESKYFIRVFKMQFNHDISIDLKLGNKVAGELVDTYRDELEGLNKKVTQFNTTRASFERSVIAYRADHENVNTQNKRRHDTWTKSYKASYAAYKRSFRLWREKHAKGQLISAQPAQDIPSFAAASLMRVISIPSSRDKMTSTDLSKVLAATAEVKVPVTSLTMSIEVVDTKSGEVVRTAEMFGYVRKSSDARHKLVDQFIKRSLL